MSTGARSRSRHQNGGTLQAKRGDGDNLVQDCRPFPQPLLLNLRSPPPWLWLANGRLWQRPGGPASPAAWLMELLQQLHWWFVRPLWAFRRPRALAPLPLALSWRACWLNSYRPSEVAWWRALGVRQWRQLSGHSPESLAVAIHSQRRRHWPAQCRPALELLSDKAALLSLAPPAWRAPFLVLHGRNGDSSLQSPDEPVWWRTALAGPGLVLKPLHGHAGRGVIRFRQREHGLEQQALFRQLPADAPVLAGATAPDPATLFDHWRRLCRGDDSALASPYQQHSPSLPASDPAVVVRVITGRSNGQEPVEVETAWLEVPLSAGPVVFLNPQGRCLPLLGEPLTSQQQQQELDQWQNLLARELPGAVCACLEASLQMQALLPPIDRVAWDWIPADPEPRLLEGNGNFGLLIPQLFERLQTIT